jgi:DMSO/TMAO reductase YedYZ molybdopterin-dependent catalytic subunit
LNFFRVDINLRSPRPDQVVDQARQQASALADQHQLNLPEADYVLGIYGLVEQPRIVSLEQILALDRVDQFATLECISNPIAGDLIDTTLFSGAQLAQILAMAGLKDQVEDVVFHCADGYSESLPLSSALDERTLLCYAMGGEALSEQHGFPFRLYTPDRFGMKNPKWIVAIEAVAEDYSGYWPERGWVEQAWVQTEAVIDSIEAEQAGTVNLAGIAFAGARGISAVEVRVDDSGWERAALNRPLSPLTWVQWSHTFPGLDPGEHTCQARAVDGRGQLQPAAVAEPFPAGATGYHSRQLRL